MVFDQVKCQFMLSRNAMGRRCVRKWSAKLCEMPMLRPWRRKKKIRSVIPSLNQNPLKRVRILSLSRSLRFILSWKLLISRRSSWKSQKLRSKRKILKKWLKCWESSTVHWNQWSVSLKRKTCWRLILLAIWMAKHSRVVLGKTRRLLWVVVRWFRALKTGWWVRKLVRVSFWS